MENTSRFRIPIHKFLVFVFAFPLFTLTGCGGGSSSSGAGGAAPAQHVGTYTGTLTLMVNVPGVLSEQISGPITVVVSPDGVVSISAQCNFGPCVTPGSINGDNVTAGGDSNFDAGDGITCSGTESWQGTISGNTINGSASGSGNCSGPGGVVGFTLTGNFSATKTDEAAMKAPVAKAGGVLLGTIAERIAASVR